MFHGEVVVRTVAEDHRPGRLVETGFVVSVAQDIENARFQPSAPRSRAKLLAPRCASGATALPGHTGCGRGSRGATQSIERRRHDVRNEVVMARWEGDREVPIGSSVELCRTTGTRPGPAAEPPVLGRQEPSCHESIEMEGGEFAADAQRSGCLVAAHRSFAGGHQLVQLPALGIIEEGERLDRILDEVVGSSWPSL